MQNTIIFNSTTNTLLSFPTIKTNLVTFHIGVCTTQQEIPRVRMVV